VSNGGGRRRSEKPTVPRPELAQLGRRLVNLGLNVANEAAARLLEIGRHKELADLTRKTVDYQSALESYRAYEKTQKR
jgi:hypothetical protein